MDSKNIFIIGAMGSGKSSIGRLLAKKMKREFVYVFLAIVQLFLISCGSNSSYEPNEKLFDEIPKNVKIDQYVSSSILKI